MINDAESIKLSSSMGIKIVRTMEDFIEMINFINFHSLTFFRLNPTK
jgi:hypothetical protein